MFFTPFTQSAMRVISWKCVAKRQKGLTFWCRYSQIYQAIPKPQLVLVPRPNQSIRTREWDVAVSSMHELSSISLMKVEMPLTCRSDAPTRVMIASTIGVWNQSAGTQEPIWARQAQTPMVRMQVDFPPMLGPVKTTVFSSANEQSLGTQFLMQGCLIPLPTKLSPNLGRHHIPLEVITTVAIVLSTSSQLNRKERSSMTGQYPATSSNIFRRSTCCQFLYSSSTILSRSHSLPSVSVVKVILVCLAVRNLQPGVSLTLLMASFLLASRTYLWVFEGIFSTQRSKCLATLSTQCEI